MCCAINVPSWSKPAMIKDFLKVGGKKMNQVVRNALGDNVVINKWFPKYIYFVG